MRSSHKRHRARYRRPVLRESLRVVGATQSCERPRAPSRSAAAAPGSAYTVDTVMSWERSSELSWHTKAPFVSNEGWATCRVPVVDKLFVAL